MFENIKSSIVSIEPYHDGLKDGYDTQYTSTGVRGCVGSINCPYIWQSGEYKRYVNPEDWIARDADGKKYIIPIGVVKLLGLDLEQSNDKSNIDMGVEGSV
jgi:hypothetical protein